MALKDTVVSLVLKAKNAISPEADPARESLEKLQQETRDLEAAQRDLERQQQATTGFKAAEEAAASSAKQLDKAVTAYERLKQEGKQAGQSQAEYALEVRKARTEQGIANTEYNRSQRTLAKYTRTLNEAGVDTRDLASAENKIQRELDQTRASLSKTTAETKRQSKALEDAERSSGRFGNLLSGLKGKLVGLAAGVGVFAALKAGITKLLTTGSDLEILQRQFTGLYGSVDDAKRALKDIDRIAENNAQSLGDTAEAARRLKVAGIDPLDGSLQKLIDANAKYGSGAQTLDTLITQLGQSWQSERLQLEELNSITDSGIPIMEALGNITGKAGGEIRKMASAGDLGRDVMRQLIDELGRMSEGAGAARINGLSGLVASLKKEVNDFFRAASESGVLDSLNERLKRLLLTLREMQADGSIAEWARGVSDSLSTILSASERVASGVAVFWNVVTAAWRTGASAITGSASLVSGAFSKILGALGADEISAKLDAFSEKTRRLSKELIDNARNDIDDIQAHAARAFKTIDDAASAGAESQKKASKEKSESVVRDYDAEVEAALKASQAQKQAAASAAAANRDDLGNSLKDLGLDLGTLTTKISDTEQKAIDSFSAIGDQIAKAGLTAQQQAEIIAKAYQAALGKVDGEEGRKALVDALNASLNQLNLTEQEYNKTQAATAAAHERVIDSLKRAIEITQQTTQQATTGEQQKQTAARQTSGAYRDQGNAAQQAASQEVSASARAQSAAAALLKIYTDLKQSYYETSKSAGLMFDELYREQTQFSVLSIGSWLKALNRVKTDMDGRLARSQRQYDRAMSHQGQNLALFIRDAQGAQRAASFLGEEKLSTLNSALRSATQQMESLKSSAQSTLNSLESQLVNLTGTQQQIDRQAYESRQQQLRDQLEQAQKQGAGDAVSRYREALKVSEQLYQAQQEKTRQEQEANKRREAEAAAAERQPPTSTVAPTQKIEIALPNGATANLEGDPEDVSNMMDFLNQAGMRATQ